MKPLSKVRRRVVSRAEIEIAALEDVREAERWERQGGHLEAARLYIDAALRCSALGQRSAALAAMTNATRALGREADTIVVPVERAS